MVEIVYMDTLAEQEMGDDQTADWDNIIYKQSFARLFQKL